DLAAADGKFAAGGGHDQFVRIFEGNFAGQVTKMNGNPRTVVRAFIDDVVNNEIRRIDLLGRIVPLPNGKSVGGSTAAQDVAGQPIHLGVGLADIEFSCRVQRLVVEPELALARVGRGRFAAVDVRKSEIFILEISQEFVPVFLSLFCAVRAPGGEDDFDAA